MSRLLVTITLLTTVDNTLSISPSGASRPICCRRSSTLISACRSHCRWSVHRDLSELRVAAEVPQVVTPEPRLRLVIQRLPQSILQIRFFGINHRGQPYPGPQVLPPAIKVQVITGARMRVVSAIEANDVVILVLDPDTAKKPAFASVLLRRHVHHYAAYFAQKFPPHEREIVVLTLKILIEHYHLGKAQRQEPHGIDILQLAEHLLAQPFRRRRSENAVRSSFAHIQAAQKIYVTAGDGGVELFVFLEILEISFHQRMKLLHLRQEEMFALDGSIDHLIKAAGGGAGLLRGGVPSRELRLLRGLCKCSLAEQ